MRNDERYRYVFIVLAVLVFGVCGCDTESNTEDPDLNYFVKYYGGDGNQYGVDMVAMNDGTFVLLGTYEEETFDTDVYLMRVSADGDVIWETRYGEDDEIWTPKDIELASDGNLIIVSDFKASPTERTMVRLLKYSPDGTFITLGHYQTKTLGSLFSRTVTPLSDGGFIVSGMTDSTSTISLVGETDPDLGDAFDLRVDQNLVRWELDEWIVYNGFGSNIDVAVKAFERPTGDFYIFGYSNSQLTGDLNPNERLGLLYFSRDATNSVDKVWYPGNVVTANDTEINFVCTVPPAIGGGYLVVGTSVNSIGLSELFMARMRPSLTFYTPLSSEATFYNTIGFNRNIRGVSGCPSLSGEIGFLLLGNEARSTGATNFVLSKVNQIGVPLWSTTFGSEVEDDKGAAVAELPDGKIVVLGTMGLADNQSKMAFIKVNREGKLVK